MYVSCDILIASHLEPSMKSTLLFASVILCAVSAHAADVKGQTFNTVEEQPEPYATIRIFALTDTVKPVTF